MMGMVDRAAELKSGDHRRALLALRDVLADHLLAAKPSVSAQIAARLQAVLNDLAGLPSVGKVSVVDEVKKAREKRRSA